MAKTLAELCVPRTTVFETARADTVLSIRDLVGGSINAAEFFTSELGSPKSPSKNVWFIKTELK